MFENQKFQTFNLLESDSTKIKISQQLCLKTMNDFTRDTHKQKELKSFI